MAKTKGRFDCNCVRKRIVKFKDGKTYVNDVDTSQYENVYLEDFDEAPDCMFGCGKKMFFKDYDTSTVFVGKFSAQSTEAKRESLKKRRDDFNKSKEGQYMRQRANFNQLGHEAG